MGALLLFTGCAKYESGDFTGGDTSTSSAAVDCSQGGCVALRPSCPAESERGCQAAVVVQGGTLSLGAVGIEEPVQPQISVSNFWIDAQEVTVARFRRFVQAGSPVPANPVAYPANRTVPPGAVREAVSDDGNAICNWSASPGSREEHPINCVDWYTALAFCAWDGGRLPTETEWEWAARGRTGTNLTTGRAYPWGDFAPTCGTSHYNQCQGEEGAETKKVASFPNVLGISDQAGNVAEWVADVSANYGDPNCWGDQVRQDPLCTQGGTNFVTRGGSFQSDANNGLHSAQRESSNALERRDSLGFRCARSP